MDDSKNAFCFINKKFYAIEIYFKILFISDLSQPFKVHILKKMSAYILNMYLHGVKLQNYVTDITT